MTDELERLRSALPDRYLVERELGRGGMATVYLAEDTKHGRQVAIKVLHPELAAALGTARFLREIETAAQLSHPHILSLHDSGESEGFLYYVMPYVEGESLRDRLQREEQLPVDDALAIAAEVAGALSELLIADAQHSAALDSALGVVEAAVEAGATRTALRALSTAESAEPHAESEQRSRIDDYRRRLAV
jgi:hypothetical protein